MNRILIAESDAGLAQRLREIFTDSNTYVMSCDTIKKARTMFECEEWTVAVIDEKMMDGNGYNLLEEIDDDIIVAMILNENEALDARSAYGYKIADFINKPFNPTVLKAKVYTQISHKASKSNIASSACFDALGVAFPEFVPGDNPVYIDKYEFDFENRQYKCGGINVMLGSLEQELLKLLVENRGAVLKKNTLMERLHIGNELEDDGGALAEAAQLLVEKLDAFKYIKTIFGIGYMWASDADA